MRPEQFHTPQAALRTIADARVSSHDQKDDRERQKQVLEWYCARQGWTFEVIADLRLRHELSQEGAKETARCRLDAVIDGEIGRLVMTHQDRRLRFGAELVFALCEAKNIAVVILNGPGNDATPE